MVSDRVDEVKLVMADNIELLLHRGPYLLPIVFHCLWSQFPTSKVVYLKA